MCKVTEYYFLVVLFFNILKIFSSYEHECYEYFRISKVKPVLTLFYVKIFAIVS